MVYIDWILGVSIMFGLALVLNYYTIDNIKGFFVFLTFFNAFVVFANLLPYWTLILNIVVLCFIMYVELSKKGVSE